MKLARNLELPDDIAATQKYLILGRTGSGKTNTAVVMAEELLEQRCPLVILDPMGNWWGLKSKYKVIQFGGDRGDVPLEPSAGKLVADFVIAERQPVILDLKPFSDNDMARFATDFAKRLYQKNQDPVQVFVDEADLFAPQSGADGPRAVCLGAMQNLMRRGRSCGIGMTVITQRSASLHTDMRTQCEVLFAHQTTGPHDVEAIRLWIRYHIGKEQTDILKAISQLQPGECYVFSPAWLNILDKFHIRRRKCFDSAATPKVGEDRKIPPFKTIQLEQVRDLMSATIAEAKANDPDTLKQRIHALEQELLEAQQADAAADPEDLQELQRLLEAAHAHCGAIQQRYDEVLEKCTDWQIDVERRLAEIQFIATDRPSLLDVQELINRPLSELPPIELPLTPSRRALAASPMKALLNAEDHKFLTAVNAQGTLTAMQTRFLTALAQHPDGLSKGQLLILARYASSGPVSKCFAQMTRDGWVASNTAGWLQITAAGRQALGPFEPLPTGAKLRAHVLADANLKPIDKAILSVLFQHYPKDIAKGALLDLAGYKSSGPVSKSFAKLVRLGWAISTKVGHLKASETFYKG